MKVHEEVIVGDIPYRKAPGFTAILVAVVLLILAVLAAWGTTSMGEFSNWL